MIGYMNHKVCMVGLASGLVLGMLGYTHCSIEDVSIMRSIPGITVISPADCGATFKAILSAVGDHHQSVYIRLLILKRPEINSSIKEKSNLYYFIFQYKICPIYS